MTTSLPNPAPTSCTCGTQGPDRPTRGDWTALLVWAACALLMSVILVADLVVGLIRS